MRQYGPFAVTTPAIRSMPCSRNIAEVRIASAWGMPAHSQSFINISVSHLDGRMSRIASGISRIPAWCHVLAVIPDRLIVMTKLPGSHLALALSALQGQQTDVRCLSQAFGRAIGQLTQVPLSCAQVAYTPQRDFSIIGWGQDLRQTVAHYLETARRIQQVIAAYQAPLFAHSLALLESQLPLIPRQPELLYHEDISNTMFDGEQIGGFYDLEMCRGGTAAMQLGVALFLCGPDQLDWESLLAGYQQQTAHRLDDDEILSVLAMSHFYAWIRVCRWGWWDGNPTASDHFAASVADADCYYHTIGHACNVLSRYHPVVMDWLGTKGARG